MRVREIMVKPVLTVGKNATLKQVARLMVKRNIGCVPVVDGRKELIGIITETEFMAKKRDLPFSTFYLPRLFGKWMTKEGLEQIYNQAAKIKVGEMMSPDVVTVQEGDAVAEVVDKMLKHNIKHVPVVQEKKIVGIVSRHDLLRLLSKAGKQKRVSTEKSTSAKK